MNLAMQSAYNKIVFFFKIRYTRKKTGITDFSSYSNLYAEQGRAYGKKRSDRNTEF